MAKELKPTDLYRLMAIHAKTYDEEEAKKYVEALIKILIVELQKVGKCSIWGLGTWKTDISGGYERTSKMVDGSIKQQYVPEKYCIKFKPSVGFYDKVNGELISHSYQKRERAGRPPKQDYILNGDDAPIKRPPKEYIPPEVLIERYLKTDRTQVKTRTRKEKKDETEVSSEETN